VNRREDSNPPLTLSERTTVKMPVSFHVSLVCGICALVWIFAGLREMLLQHEERIHNMETQVRTMEGTLNRIDERTGEIKRQMDRK